MRILIFAIGSMGDVAPLTGVGARLREVGHEVTLAAYEEFADVVRRCGLGYRAVPGSALDLFRSERGRRWVAAGTGVRGMGRMYRHGVEQVRTTAAGMVEAARAGADAVLVGAPSAVAHHIAEGLGVPSLGVFLQPMLPTGQLPPVALGGAHAYGRWGNKAVSFAAGVGVGIAFRKVIDEVRAMVDLPPVRTAAQRQESVRRMFNALHGISPSVVPRPTDWPDAADVVGYWWPAWSSDSHLPDRVTAFLDGGAPPVYVGLSTLPGSGRGSIPIEIVRDALRGAGMRGIVQTTDPDLVPAGDDDLLVLCETVRHDLLFPRTSALVHPASAGITAASLRAGRAVVPVPAASDQPFWARRLVHLRVAPRVLPARTLRAAPLAAAIRAVVDDPSYTRRATGLATRIAAEDGAARVVEAVDRLC